MTAKGSIFTRLTNEVRDDNVVLLQNHRKEQAENELRKHLTSKFMNTYETEKTVLDEVDSILFQRSLGGSSALDAHSTIGSWQTMASSRRTRATSPGRKSVSREQKAATRANEMRHVTLRWHRGPVAIGQPRILAPLVSRQGEPLRNYQAKKVQRQTLRLLHNMERGGEMSRRHATIRRRLMENAKDTGRDHVIKSLEPYLPETEEVKAEKLMLSQILANSRMRVKFVPLSEIPHPASQRNGGELVGLKEKQQLLNRLDVLWVILNPSDAVKLEFKFIIKDMSDDNAYDHRGKLNYLTVAGLEDLYRHINILETLKRVFDLSVENNVNPYCESESLIAPIVDFSAEVGLKRITKGLREDVYSWLLRIIDALLQKVQHIIEQWAAYRDKCRDGFGVQFFENMGDEVACFLPPGVPDFAVAARSRPNSSAESLGEQDGLTSVGGEGSPDTKAGGSVVSHSASISSQHSGQSLGSMSSVRALRASAAPKPVPRSVTTEAPMTSRVSSQQAKQESIAGKNEQHSTVVEIVEEPKPVVKTRQQQLLDEINSDKISSVVDVGLLLKYYTKKPNVRKPFSEEQAAEEKANEEASRPPSPKEETPLALSPKPQPKPPFISSTVDSFHFSSGDFQIVHP